MAKPFAKDTLDETKGSSSRRPSVSKNSPMKSCRRRSCASPCPIQPATEIRKGEGYGSLAGDVAHGTAGLDDFLFCIGPRQILEPAMAAAMGTDREAIRTQLADLVPGEIRRGPSADSPADRRQLARRIGAADRYPARRSSAANAAADEVGDRSGGRGRQCRAGHALSRTRFARGAGGKRVSSPNSRMIASTRANRRPAPTASMHNDATLSRKGTALSIRSVITKNTQSTPLTAQDRRGDRGAFRKAVVEGEDYGIVADVARRVSPPDELVVGDELETVVADRRDRLRSPRSRGSDNA